MLVNSLKIHHRKARLEKILARTQGLRFCEHIDGDGASVFEHACKMGLEGIVSKRRDFPYRSGWCRSWVKTRKSKFASSDANSEWELVVFEQTRIFWMALSQTEYARATAELDFRVWEWPTKRTVQRA